MIREVEKNFEGGLAVQSEVLKQSKKRACMGIGSASDGTYLKRIHVYVEYRFIKYLNLNIK